MASEKEIPKQNLHTEQPWQSDTGFICLLFCLKKILNFFRPICLFESNRSRGLRHSLKLWFFLGQYAYLNQIGHGSLT